jgi:hypothetical protein
LLKNVATPPLNVVVSSAHGEYMFYTKLFE